MDNEPKQYLEAMEGRLVEKMRDMQTALLRGFASFRNLRLFGFAKSKQINPTWTQRYPVACPCWKNACSKLSSVWDALES